MSQEEACAIRDLLQQTLAAGVDGRVLSPYQRAAHEALRELTGLDPFPTARAWNRCTDCAFRKKRPSRESEAALSTAPHDNGPKSILVFGLKAVSTSPGRRPGEFDAPRRICQRIDYQQLWHRCNYFPSFQPNPYDSKRSRDPCERMAASSRPDSCLWGESLPTAQGCTAMAQVIAFSRE